MFCGDIIGYVLPELVWASSRENLSSRGFRQSEFHTSLLSYIDYLENWNFTCSKFSYDTFQKANNKGADQTAWMCRLVCTCVVRKPPRKPRRGPFVYQLL